MKIIQQTHDHFKKNPYGIIVIVCGVIVSIVFAVGGVKFHDVGMQVQKLHITQDALEKKLFTTTRELSSLKAQDQYVINKKLQTEIDNIQKTYKRTVTTYEQLLDFKQKSKDTSDLDKLFALSLSLLSERKYASASSTLDTLASTITKEETALASKQSIPANIPENNTAPSGGFSRQNVTSNGNSFLVDLIAGDLSTTKIIVDTASDNDCTNNCPALSLADYVSRNGAFAGINGSYFCPPEYPSCAGKTNSFDLLAMNKNKHYFNSDNNVYSTNPLVVFGGSWIRFVSQGLGWGRDTGVDGVLMNFPLLIQDKHIVFSGSNDGKFASKGPRGFIASKGNIAFIGFVYNATMDDSAHVLETLGMDNAMNLDEGGSTALWYGGYKAGPGRNIPNAILFIKK